MIDRLEARRLLATWTPSVGFGDNGSAVAAGAAGQLVMLDTNEMATVGLGPGDSGPFRLSHISPQGDVTTTELPGGIFARPLIAGARGGRVVIAQEIAASQFAVVRYGRDNKREVKFKTPPFTLKGVDAELIALTLDDNSQDVYLGITVRSRSAVDYRIYRFTVDGVPDRTYGNGRGYAVASSSPDGSDRPVDQQPTAARDGSHYVLLERGRNAVLRRIDHDGKIVTDYGDNGTAVVLAVPEGEFSTDARLTGLTVDDGPSNRLLIAGYDDNDGYPINWLTAVKSTGALGSSVVLDTSFGNGGRIGLGTRKHSFMEEWLYDSIRDVEVARNAYYEGIFVVTESGLYRYDIDGRPAADTGENGLIETGEDSTYPAYGKAAEAAAVGIAPYITQIEVNAYGSLFAGGDVSLSQNDNHTEYVDQPRVVLLRPEREQAGVLRGAGVLYVSGTEGSDRIRVSANQRRITVDFNGQIKSYRRSLFRRVQIDLRFGGYTERKLFDDVRVSADMPTTVFGGPRVDRISTTGPSVIVADDTDVVRTGDYDDTLYIAGNAGGGQFVTNGGNDVVNAISSYHTIGSLDTGDGDDRVTVEGASYAETGAFINLGRGNDAIRLNALYQTVYGGLGDDRFVTEFADTRLYGEAGVDTFETTGGGDLLDGGDGDDRFYVGADAIEVTVNGGVGNDTVYARQKPIRTTRVERFRGY